MTSNPYLTEYIEQVQKSLAVFSLSDEQAKKHLRLSDSIVDYSPKFLVFETLIFDEGRRMFDPHVSDLTINTQNPEDVTADLGRLYANKKNLGFEWQEIDCQKKEFQQREQLKPLELWRLPEDLRDLDLIYQRWEDSKRKSLEKSDATRAGQIIKKLIQRYEMEYMPTNQGANALIYEAWKQGKFLPLGHEAFGQAVEEEQFEQLTNALFIDTKTVVAKDKLGIMSKNLQLDIDEESKLSDGQLWKQANDQKWFTCVEFALIHKTIAGDNKVINRYLIHYPLILDDYWFVGFTYLYSNFTSSDQEASAPEIFNRNKYPKIYYCIESISESLKDSLRRDALAKAFASEGYADKTVEDLFFETVKEYLICFEVVREGETLPSAIVDYKPIYTGHDIRIYGPGWSKSVHKNLLKDELEGKKESEGEKSLPGLYKNVLEQKQQRDAIRLRATKEQSSQLAHQAAGLISEVWCDPARKQLELQAQGCLWQLKSLIDIWGNFDLLPNQSMVVGSDAAFPEWATWSDRNILEGLIDIGVSHALRRATYRRPGGGNLGRQVRRRALHLIDEPETSIAAFKQAIGLDVKVDRLPEWIRYRGFALCFHHCFWQAAHHAFRAACDDQPTPCLRISKESEAIVIWNRTKEDASSDRSPRDKEFYQTLADRVEGFFKIQGPIQSDRYFWKTAISIFDDRGDEEHEGEN